MFNKTIKTLFFAATFIIVGVGMSFQAKADEYDDYKIEGMNLVARETFMLKTKKSGVVVRDAASASSNAVATISSNSIYEVDNYDVADEWIKIKTDSFDGYVKNTDDVIVYETVSRDFDEEMITRQEIVDYALDFVGNRYVWGGIDPNTGADCSGFTRYIMKNKVGVDLPHSSVAQSNSGVRVSRENLKPGDLVFYGDGGIEHVAIYMGNDLIVHASSAKTGIKVSNVDYRRPVKYISVLN